MMARTLALPPEQIVGQTAFKGLQEDWNAAELWLGRFEPADA
jgi:hypothetical protein